MHMLFELRDPQDILVQYVQRMSEVAAELAEEKARLLKEIESIEYRARAIELHSALFQETLKRLS